MKALYRKRLFSVVPLQAFRGPANQCPGRFLGIIDRYLPCYRRQTVHVDTFRYTLNSVVYIAPVATKVHVILRSLVA